uniref:Membrane protein n=1 Tax=Mycobacterium phage Pharb TaxID=3136626 RepID=A0AAU8GRN2_9VIRU
MTLTALAVAAAAVSLIIRRRTWRAPGEVAATVAVLLFGLATYLSSDQCNVGETLWQATGLGYLDNFAGQLLYISGMLAVLQQALYRVADDVERTEIIDAFVRGPINLLIPGMLSTMYMSAALHDEPVEFDVMAHGADVWALLYRGMYLACMAYITLLVFRVLRTVQRTGGGYVVSSVYLLGCAISLTTCTLRVVEMVHPTAHLNEIPVTLRALLSIVVSIAAAASWLIKMRGYRRLLRQTRTTRRQRRGDTLQSHRERLTPTTVGVHDDDGDQLTPANPRI